VGDGPMTETLYDRIEAMPDGNGLDMPTQIFLAD
jgi:hypothetical protein